MIPVNPQADKILGIKTFPDLTSIPDPIDVVQVFRPAEEAQEIVQEAIKIGAKTVWMQEGIVNNTAADAARSAGLNVVMDTCMRVAYKRLM